MSVFAGDQPLQAATHYKLVGQRCSSASISGGAATPPYRVFFIGFTRCTTFLQVSQILFGGCRYLICRNRDLLTHSRGFRSHFPILIYDFPIFFCRSAILGNGFLILWNDFSIFFCHRLILGNGFPILGNRIPILGNEVFILFLCVFDQICGFLGSLAGSKGHSDAGWRFARLPEDNRQTEVILAQS